MNSEDILKTIDKLEALWDELDDEFKVLINGLLVSIPLRWYSKRYWLKRGAPEWAAKAIASLGVGITLAPATYAVKIKTTERERVKRETQRKLNARLR